jgi:adenylate cyclase
LDIASNPIFFQGEQTSRFQLRIGEHFVIGQTRFSLVDEQAHVSMLAPIPAHERTFSAHALRRASFRHVQQQVEALTRLPEIVAAAESDQELHISLINLILTAIPTADAAAVIFCPPDGAAGQSAQILHWDSVGQEAVEFQPSAMLISAAEQAGQSVLHNWHRQALNEPIETTAHEPFDWAFCAPIPGVACRGQMIYVAGSASVDDGGAADWHDALKFVELVGTTVGHVCDLRQLQRRSATLAQFFSPPVRDVVAAADPDVVLAPRMTEVSVLFCDLRGFSRQSEQAAEDLFGLLQRVSQALGVMTRQILEFGGVVGDFHGDAAMGFWGWPLADDERVARASRAALAICHSFQQVATRDQPALANFRVGIGIATGQAVAGKIGTADQVKVTAFGPVVNRASRLEGLTRSLGVSILVDRITANIARQHLLSSEADIRFVARLQPYGMIGVEDVFELVPAALATATTWQRDAELLSEALAAFHRGDWQTAETDFQQLSPGDPIRRYYLRFIEQHAHRPPSSWDGVIRFSDKP